MYDIQWRIKVDVSKYLSTDEKEQYIEKLKNLLKYINDDIIMEQKYYAKKKMERPIKNLILKQPVKQFLHHVHHKFIISQDQIGMVLILINVLLLML